MNTVPKVWESLRRCSLLIALLFAQGDSLARIHAASPAEPEALGAVAPDELPGHPPAGHDEQSCTECLAGGLLASAALPSPASPELPCAVGAFFPADARTTPEAAPDSIRRPRAPPAKRLA